MKKAASSGIGTIVDYFATFFSLLILLIQCPYFINYYMTQDDFQDTLLGFNPPAVIGVAFFLPLFYSLVRIMVLHNASLRKAFCEQADSLRTFTDRCKFFVCRIVFWCETAAFAILYWILPLKWFCMPIVRQFTDGTPDIKDKALLFIILLPIMLVLNILARLSAMNAWLTTDHIIRETKFNYSEAGLKRQLLICCIAYGVGGILLNALIPGVAFILLPLLGDIPNYINLYAVLSTAGILVLLWIAFIFLRAFIKRRSFLKKLQSVCKAKGYTVSQITRPYLSVWMFKDGESFSVEANGKRYSCKLIGGLRRRVRTILFADGQGFFGHSLRLFKQEVLRYESWFCFGYDSEDTKILIINPIPKHIYIQHQGKLHSLDNGDHVGDFSMYSASAFLNALERDSIDS